MSDPNIRKFELVPGVVIDIEIHSNGIVYIRSNGHLWSCISPYTEGGVSQQSVVRALFPLGYIPPAPQKLEQATEVSQ